MGLDAGVPGVECKPERPGQLMAIVPLYLPRDRLVLETHFAALGVEDLRNRFCGSIRPEIVGQYIERLSATGVPSYGIFNPGHALVAVCQLGQSEHGLEVGLTVLPAYRRQGLAKALLGRCASYARARGSKALIIHCQADNIPMLTLARRIGMHVETSHGDADGRLTLRSGTALDFWTDIAYAQEGIAESVMRIWQVVAQMVAGGVVSTEVAPKLH
jgi:GNAT superfamily N-acetyltransferase